MSTNTFIPYQVDYSVKNTAKTFGPSKKKVIFKFGFASDNAVNDGQTGPACRGSEHELVFIWSLKSGKRQLILDNKDLHFSESGQNGWTSDRAWQHAFTLRDPMSKKQYRVHFLSQPVVKEEPQQHGGFTASPTTTVSRPFDLKIGGLSYFEFNPIYQLGTDRMVTGDADRAAQRHHKHRSGRDSPMDYEERRQLEAAKLASLQEMQQREQKQVEGVTEVIQKLQRQEDPLISFDDDPMPAPQPPTQVVTTSSAGGSIPGNMANNQNNNYFASSITLDPMIDSSAQLQPPGSLLTNPYGSSAPAPSGNNMYGTTNPYGGGGTSQATSTMSTGLVPYTGGQQQQQQQQQTYVDATGRVSVVQQQQQPSAGMMYNNQQQQQQPPGMYNSTSSNMNYAGQSSQSTLNYSSSTNQNPYGSSPPPMYPTANTSSVPYNNNASNPNMMYNNNNNNMVSPQSTNTYGSAPSFAQPPRPPQPNNNNYGGGGYPPQQPQQPSYNY